jgi:hypothetical protein
MYFSEMDSEQQDVYLAVHRSVRYHERRRAWFVKLHRITSALTVLMSGTVLLMINNTMPSNTFINIISVIAAIFAAGDVLIGFSNKAEKHQGLKRKFNALEQKMVEGDNKRQTWLKHASERIQIERDETSIYRALDVLCHNETSKAFGLDDEVVKLVPFQAWTANIFKWQNIASSL